jgi:hypothetical protein
MSEQFPPVASQRRQWYEYVCGSAPAHEPLLAVRLCPTCGVPAIVGGAVFRGAPAAGAASTIALAFDVDAAEPSAFVAVTRTRRRQPTSARRTTYVCPNACEIPVQLTPLAPPPEVSQRSQ